MISYIDISLSYIIYILIILMLSIGLFIKLKYSTPGSKYLSYSFIITSFLFVISYMFINNILFTAEKGILLILFLFYIIHILIYLFIINYLNIYNIKYNYIYFINIFILYSVLIYLIYINNFKFLYDLTHYTLIILYIPLIQVYLLLLYFITKNRRSKYTLYILIIGIFKLLIINFYLYFNFGDFYNLFLVIPFNISFILIIFIISLNYDLFKTHPMYFNPLINNIKNPIITVDIEGRIIYSNERFKDNFDKKYIKSKLLDSNNEINKFYNKNKNYDLRIKHDDDFKYYNLNISKIKNKSNIIGYIIIFNDITDIIDYEKRLEIQQNQIKKLSDSLAHEFRNPFNILLGYLYNIKIETDNEELNYYIDDSISVINELIDVNDDFKKITKYSSYSENIQNINFYLLVKQKINSLDNMDNFNIYINGKGDVNVDPERFTLIIDIIIKQLKEINKDKEDITLIFSKTDYGFYIKENFLYIEDDEKTTLFKQGYTSNNRAKGVGFSMISVLAESQGYDIELELNKRYNQIIFKKQN